MSTLRDTLKNGGIAVLPTDTIYGVCASAFHKKTIERLYQVRDRDAQKPFIILIANLDQLRQFGVRLTANQKQQLEVLWPGKISVILPVRDKKFAYLHRGTKTLAFRWPKKKELERLIAEIGPIAAPSANPQGKPPATTIKAAKKYFGSSVDFYQSGDTLKGKPSTLIRFDNDEIVVVREGAVKF